MPGKPEIIARSDFAAGIVADTARHRLPANAVVDAFDILLNEPGKAVKRGGCAFQSGELEGQDSIIGVAAPEYPGDPRVLAFASDSSNTTLFDVTTDTPSTPGSDQDCDSALLLENPPFLVDGADGKLIVCDGRSTNAPKKAFLDTMVVKVADLTAGPPKAKYSTMHLGRLVLANSDTNQTRVWFGPVPLLEPTPQSIDSVVQGPPSTVVVAGVDVTATFFDTVTVTIEGSTGNDGTYTVVGDSVFDGTDTTITVSPTLPNGTGDGTIVVGWDTLESYFDVDTPVTGLASLGGVLIIFTRGGYYRVLGSIPPGYGVATADVDMEVQPVDGSVGCIDARSIVHAAGMVVFANEQGVWATNGAAPVSLTTKPNGTGIRRLWTAAMAGFAPALGAVCCAGVFEEWLFVTVRHPDDEEDGDGARYQFLCYLPARAWARLADGVTADMYATRFAPNSEIYAACGDISDPVRLLRLSPIFTPTGDNMADANEEDVIPFLDLPFGDAGALKSFAKGRVSHLFEVPAE